MRMLRNALIDRVGKFESFRQILYILVLYYLKAMANETLE